MQTMKADSPALNSPIALPAMKLDNLQSATNSNYCRTTQTPGPQTKKKHRQNKGEIMEQRNKDNTRIYHHNVPQSEMTVCPARIAPALYRK